MSLSMPTTVQPSVAIMRTHSDPIKPPEPVTSSFFLFIIPPILVRLEIVIRCSRPTPGSQHPGGRQRPLRQTLRSRRWFGSATLYQPRRPDAAQFRAELFERKAGTI